MSIIEIFALIVLLAALIKIITILVKPGAWFKLTKTIWKKPLITMIVSLVLAAIVLYYLLQEISIIEIFAVILFVALLSAATMAVYIKEFLDLASKLLKDKKVVKKAWLPLLIWIVLIIWALKEIFM